MVYHFKHFAIYVQQMGGKRYLNLQRIKGIQPQKKKWKWKMTFLKTSW